VATVRITEQAWSDLDAILDCYDQSAPGFSEVFEEEVVEKIRRLEEFPRMGRMVPEIGDEALRELIHRSYRIVYYVDADDDKVEVLTIFHSSQQFGGIDDEE